MKRTLQQILIVFSLVVAIVATYPQQGEAQQHLVTVGTGGHTGLYYPTGIALSDIVNQTRHKHGYRFAVETTKGSRYNLKAVQAGELDFGFVQSDVHYQAFKGIGPYTKQGPAKTLRSVMSIAVEPLHIVVKDDSGINQLVDLKGKKINAGRRGSGNLEMTRLIMEAMGWSKETFSQITYKESALQGDALCQGDIDALFLTVANQSKTLTDLTEKCHMKFVNISGQEIDKYLDNHGFVGKAVIPGGVYPGISQKTSTIGPLTTLVVNERVPDDIVYQLVNAVFSNFEGLKKAHPAFADLEKKRMVKVGLTAPLHDGASRYYKKSGLLQ